MTIIDEEVASLQIILMVNVETGRYIPGRGGTPSNGLYGEAPLERGSLFRLAVCKRVGISLAEV